jgi:PilZ domain-containing protein
MGTNLSDRGMAMQLPLELRVGKKLTVVVLLDAIQQQIRCDGTVRNRNGDQYGIEFSNLYSEQRELILRCSRESR